MLFSPLARFSSLARFSLLSLFLTAGCESGAGTFQTDGFHHAEYPYVVHYADPKTKEFVSDEWSVDNYVVYGNGSLGRAKESGPYVGIRELDIRGDGHVQKTEVPLFDLKLVNKRTSAVIWVHAFPVSPSMNDRELRVLMDEYVETISGTGFYVVDVGAKSERHVQAKTYASKIVDSKETKVGGLDAFEATIELANLDQLRFDPNHRAAVANVVLVKTDYFEKWIEYNASPSRVFVRVGYEANPQDFKDGLPAFETFLSQIAFGPPKKD